MSKYTATAASSNILDAAMDALRPHVSPAAIQAAQFEARAASALSELQRMADDLADLKQRLHLAMDSIGIAAGAWHCQECGEWTTRNVPHEDCNYCPRCAPLEAGCPF